MDLFNSTDFSSTVEALIKRYHLPGFAIAIAHKDVTASKAFGVASFDPPKPMTTDTLFDVASVSKSLTAASVALLVEDDDKYPDVMYDAEMAKLLPGDFVMPGTGYEGVTVDDVLGHRTGMASHDNSYFGVQAKHPDNARSITRNLRNLATAAPIRSEYIYCNIMYTAVAYLVEQKSGLGFSDYLDKNFFQPLGMASTNLQPSRARAKGLGDRIARGHWWDLKAYSHVEFDLPESPEAEGAGSIITSVNDFIKYVRALMNKEAPFSESVYEGIIKPRTITTTDYKTLSPFSAPPVYASGWEVHNYRGHAVMVHDGYITGSSTSHFFVPALDFAGAAFGNAGSGSLVAEIVMQTLIDELLGLPQEQRVDWDKVLYEKYSRKKYDEIDKEDNKDEEEVEEQRQKLSPGIKESEPQKMPLSAYMGEYWNPGWRGLTVQVKDERLFIDSSDRSYVFTLDFHHVCEQTKYVVLMKEVAAGPNFPLRAEFRFENNAAVKMGIFFEDDLEDYIWFDRVAGDEAGGAGDSKKLPFRLKDTV